jgi:hypothetical protein
MVILLIKAGFHTAFDVAARLYTNFVCLHSVQRLSSIDDRQISQNFSAGMFVNYTGRQGEPAMFTFLLWCLLFVLCWPLALIALVLYPFVWLLLLPFRLVGLAVRGVLELVWAAVMLPARLLSAPFRL